MYPTVMSQATDTEDLSAAISEAAMRAREEYQAAEKNPLDHGHAFVKGLDGRTRLARALKEHKAVDVQTGGYHGTTIHIRGVDRFLSAQRAAYNEFISALKEMGASGADDMTVWTHGH